MKSLRKRFNHKLKISNSEAVNINSILGVIFAFGSALLHSVSWSTAIITILVFLFTDMLYQINKKDKLDIELQRFLSMIAIVLLVIIAVDYLISAWTCLML